MTTASGPGAANLGRRQLRVTLFDTAQVYGPFVNEELVGKALAPMCLLGYVVRGKVELPVPSSGRLILV